MPPPALPLPLHEQRVPAPVGLLPQPGRGLPHGGILPAGRQQQRCPGLPPPAVPVPLHRCVATPGDGSKSRLGWCGCIYAQPILCVLHLCACACVCMCMRVCAVGAVWVHQAGGCLPAWAYCPPATLVELHQKCKAGTTVCLYNGLCLAPDDCTAPTRDDDHPCAIC